MGEEIREDGSVYFEEIWTDIQDSSQEVSLFRTRTRRANFQCFATLRSDDLAASLNGAGAAPLWFRVYGYRGSDKTLLSVTNELCDYNEGAQVGEARGYFDSFEVTVASIQGLQAWEQLTVSYIAWGNEPGEQQRKLFDGAYREPLWLPRRYLATGEIVDLIQALPDVVARVYFLRQLNVTLESSLAPVFVQMFRGDEAGGAGDPAPGAIPFDEFELDASSAPVSVAFDYRDPWGERVNDGFPMTGAARGGAYLTQQLGPPNAPYSVGYPIWIGLSSTTGIWTSTEDVVWSYQAEVRVKKAQQVA